jgi:hypothetical protein
VAEDKNRNERGQMNFNGISNGKIFSSSRVDKQLLKNTLECSFTPGAAEQCYCWYKKIFYQLSPRREEISVIKRIYSCFMKIVNSYFSITMIFSLFYSNSQFAFLATNLIHVFPVVFVCAAAMCLLVVHFSSSFDFTLHNMQNSFPFVREKAFYRL